MNKLNEQELAQNIGGHVLDNWQRERVIREALKSFSIVRNAGNARDTTSRCSSMGDNHPYKKIFLLQREGFASYDLYYTKESSEEAGRELEKRFDLYPHNRYIIYEYVPAKCVHGGDIGEHIRGEHETSVP